MNLAITSHGVLDHLIISLTLGRIEIVA